MRWRKTIVRRESSPLVPAAPSSSATGAGASMRFKRGPASCAGCCKLHGQVKGGVAISGEPRLRRRLLGPRLRAQRAHGEDPLAGEGAAALRSAAELLRARRRSRTAASTSARPTARSIRSAPRAASCAGRSRRAASSTRRRRSGADRVFAGSYSHRFFAFDAATGDVLWQFKANGPISGSATVVAGRVYFATLKGTDVRARRDAPAGRCGRSRTASTRRSSPTPTAST